MDYENFDLENNNNIESNSVDNKMTSLKESLSKEELKNISNDDLVDLVVKIRKVDDDLIASSSINEGDDKND